MAAGATHVLVTGVYNLGRSPWGLRTGQAPFVESLTSSFNNALLISIVELGATTLYVDSALFFNLVTANPPTYALTDVTSVACTSVDPGPGIGTGAGQVNSNLCTPSTVVTGSDPNRFLWADRVYPTPRGQRIFGDFAFNRIHERW